MEGCLRKISASFLPAVTIFNTPSGNPASIQSSAILMTAWGTKLAALSTNVFPLAIQSGAIHPMGIIAGKFQGAIPAKTPRDSLNCTVSYPFDTFMRDSPFNSWGIPQANSTTSVTFKTSPIASSHFLPSDDATMCVNSSKCLSSRAFILKRT